MQTGPRTRRLSNDHTIVATSQPSTPVSPAPDSEANVLRAKQSKIDDLLESLHRTLRSQDIAVVQVPTGGLLSGTTVMPSNLSGGKVSKVGRKHDHAKEAKKKSPPVKKVPVENFTKPISKLEELVLAAQALGIDMFYVSELVKEAKLAQSRGGDPRRISSCITKAEKRAEELIMPKLPGLVKQTKDSMKRLEKLQGAPSEARHLLERAKSASTRGRHSDTLRALEEARVMIRGAEHEILLKVISGSRNRFLQAKKAGLNMDLPVQLLNRARSSLGRGELEEAIKWARDSAKAVDLMLERHAEAKTALVNCVKAVRLAETLGADVQEINKILADTRSSFRNKDFDRSIQKSWRLCELAGKVAYNRAAEVCDLAERSVALAKSASVEVFAADKMLSNAREALGKDELLRSVSLSSASIFESNSAIMASLNDKLRNVDQFAKGIETEVESLTDVQEAIAHSKEKSLEDFRKYVEVSENIVSQAFDSAIAYTRVSQDIFKQAYDNSISLSPTKDVRQEQAEITSSTENSYEDKRLRIVNLYLAGRINDSQVERLLALIDSNVAKEKLV